MMLGGCFIPALVCFTELLTIRSCYALGSIPATHGIGGKALPLVGTLRVLGRFEAFLAVEVLLILLRRRLLLRTPRRTSHDVGGKVLPRRVPVLLDMVLMGRPSLLQNQTRSSTLRSALRHIAHDYGERAASPSPRQQHPELQITRADTCMSLCNVSVRTRAYRPSTV